MHFLTNQLLLLESRLKRKQKQISNILCQRELIILRQQKLIDALSSRLVDHGLDSIDPGGGNTDFDSLNDSDSAVVLEDIDSDYYSSSMVLRRNSYSGGSGCISSYGCNSFDSICNKSYPTTDVTVMRSISDAIETNLKYSITKRSTYFLRRPDMLETVYSVEEDLESDVTEKRNKFKSRSEKCLCSTDEYIDQENNCLDTELNVTNDRIVSNLNTNKTNKTNNNNKKQTHVTNYNRVMSNHRSVTKPKDVKYKRINKVKSKSLEELRGRLRHWVEKDNIKQVNDEHLQHLNHHHRNYLNQHQSLTYA